MNRDDLRGIYCLVLLVLVAAMKLLEVAPF